LFMTIQAMYAQQYGHSVDFEKHHFNFAHLPETTELTADFFAGNRQKLRDSLPDSSMAVIFSASQKSRSNDIDFQFHQDPDFFYFTGVREPNALLIVFKNPVLINSVWMNEVLFIEDKNAKKEMWTGTMVGLAGAKEISAAQHVLPNTDFKPMNFPWEKIKVVYANKHQLIERDDKEHSGDLMSLTSHFATKLSMAGKEAKINECEDLIAFFRQQKSTLEVELMQRACDITCEALKSAMTNMKPGMTEYQIEAVIEYTFRVNGAAGEAFPSIVASGENGAIMHYTDNSSLLIPGDLVVIDIGAEYDGYAADITRTIPVSGKFTEEQAAVYKLVLDAQTVGARYATAGNKFWTPHEEAFRTIGSGLISLGIIDKWSQIGDYFIHGTSHYLGLDVHDAGLFGSLKPGQVITIEPGIYIPKGSPCDPKWWNIFVRIEDDYLITDGPPLSISSAAPKSIAEIEALMGARSGGG